MTTTNVEVEGAILLVLASLSGLAVFRLAGGGCFLNDVALRVVVGCMQQVCVGSLFFILFF